MSILSIASNASAWRGYEYYEGKKVLSWKQTGEHGFEGEVAGREKEPYHVIIDIEHPKNPNAIVHMPKVKELYASTRSPYFSQPFRKRQIGI